MNSIFSTNSIQTTLHLSNNEVPKVSNAGSIDLETAPSHNPNTSSKNWPEDEISISDEAKEQLEEEKKENVDASDSSKHKSIMEFAEEIKQKTIDDLKKRIEELTEELKKLAAQGDEHSKELAKVLQRQINDLNGQLLTIMTSE